MAAAENKYLGQTPLKIGDMDGTLCFDWRAISAVKSKFGAVALNNLLENASPDMVAGIAEAGFAKLSPEITAEKIIEASPPLVPVINAIDRALTYAYFGPEAARKMLGEDKPADDAEGDDDADAGDKQPPLSPKK